MEVKRFMYERLRQELEDRQLSERKLAIMAGLAPQSINAAMNGNVKFWPGWRKKVSIALGMAEQDLFPEDAQRQETGTTDRG